ncbi:hypothetical protein RI054_39g143880 [Pseudoscourfieldia marina]
MPPGTLPQTLKLPALGSHYDHGSSQHPAALFEHFDDLNLDTDMAINALLTFAGVTETDNKHFKAHIHRSGKHTEALVYSEAKRFVRALSEVHGDNDAAPGGDDTELYHVNKADESDAAKRAKARAKIIAKARTGGARLSRRMPKWLHAINEARTLAKRARRARDHLVEYEEADDRPPTAATSFTVRSVASDAPPSHEQLAFEAGELTDRAQVAEARARRMCDEESLNVVQGYAYAERGDVRRPNARVGGSPQEKVRKTRFSVMPSGASKPPTRANVRSGLKPPGGLFDAGQRANHVRITASGGAEDETAAATTHDTLGLVGYIRLLRDARLLNNKLTTVDATDLFEKECRRCGKPPSEGIPTSGQDLRHALVVAGRRALGEPIGRHHKPPAECTTEQARRAHTFAEDWRNLLERNILPFCHSAALPIPELDLCYSQDVLHLLGTHRQRLRQMFAHYATLGSVGVGVDKESWDYCVASNCTMNIDEALQFALNFDIVPSLISKNTYLEVFREVERGNDGDELHDRISMPAFEELLVKLSRRVMLESSRLVVDPHATVTEAAAARRILRCLPDAAARDRILSFAPARMPMPRTEAEIHDAGAVRIAELRAMQQTQIQSEEAERRGMAVRRRGEARRRLEQRREQNTRMDLSVINRRHPSASSRLVEDVGKTSVIPALVIPAHHASRASSRNSSSANHGRSKLPAPPPGNQKSRFSSAPNQAYRSRTRQLEAIEDVQSVLRLKTPNVVSSRSTFVPPQRRVG